jgi:hypothetical protein
MARFHLHQHRDGSVLLDDEGGEYAFLEDAIGDAAQSAREIMADRLRSAQSVGGSEIHVCDDTGRVVSTVRFDDVIAGKPFPQAPPLARDDW